MREVKTTQCCSLLMKNRNMSKVVINTLLKNNTH